MFAGFSDWHGHLVARFRHVFIWLTGPQEEPLLWGQGSLELIAPCYGWKLIGFYWYQFYYGFCLSIQVFTDSPLNALQNNDVALSWQAVSVRVLMLEFKQWFTLTNNDTISATSALLWWIPSHFLLACVDLEHVLFGSLYTEFSKWENTIGLVFQWEETLNFHLSWKQQPHYYPSCFQIQWP